MSMNTVERIHCVYLVHELVNLYLHLNLPHGQCHMQFCSYLVCVAEMLDVAVYFEIAS